MKKTNQLIVCKDFQQAFNNLFKDNEEVLKAQKELEDKKKKNYKDFYDSLPDDIWNYPDLLFSIVQNFTFDCFNFLKLKNCVEQDFNICFFRKSNFKEIVFIYAFVLEYKNRYTEPLIYYNFKKPSKITDKFQLKFKEGEFLKTFQAKDSSLDSFFKLKDFFNEIV